MRKHTGMRPQDLAILLKIVSLGNEKWRLTDIANALNISQSEVSESINRSQIGKLVSHDKRKVYKSALLDFLAYGLKHVFPAQPGAIVRGVPTAHAAKPLSDQIVSEEHYVWEHPLGQVRGQSIEPLYKTIPDIAPNDPKLHELLALADAIRVGKAREYELAVRLLKERL